MARVPVWSRVVLFLGWPPLRMGRIWEGLRLALGRHHESLSMLADQCVEKQVAESDQAACGRSLPSNGCSAAIVPGECLVGRDSPPELSGKWL